MWIGYSPRNVSARCAMISNKLELLCRTSSDDESEITAKKTTPFISTAMRTLRASSFSSQNSNQASHNCQNEIITHHADPFERVLEMLEYIQIWPKSRGLGCVTSAPAADENRDAGFTRFRVDAHNIKAICVHSTERGTIWTFGLFSSAVRGRL